MKKRKGNSLWLTRGHTYGLGSLLSKIWTQSKGASSNSFGSLAKSIGSGLNIVGTLGDIVGTGVQLGQISDTSDEHSNINQQAGTRFSGTSAESLLGEWNSTNLLDNQYNMEDVRGYSDGEMAGKIAGSVGKGAMTGLTVGGPIGAVIGGLIGGIGSGIGAVVGTNRAKTEADMLSKLQEQANNKMLNTYSSQVQYADTQNALNRTIAADGGGIHIKKKNRGKFTEAAKRAGMGVQEYARHVLANKDRYSPTLVKRANFARNVAGWRHDLGGYLFSHGADWNNGISTIDTGGTHAENPYGGIPMGIAPDNQPNLVEQGEVIYKDYVFSNRLTPDKKEMKGFNIPSKYNGWSFAKIAEDMSKESSERPNDPISKNGLEDSMSKLMMLQEMERNKKGKKGTQQMMAYGGHKYDGLSYNPIYGMVSPFTIPEQPLQTPVLEETTPPIQNTGTTNRLNTYTNYEALPKDTDFYSPEYMAFWNRIKANPTGELAQQLLTDINSGKYGNVGGNTFTIDDILRLSHDYKKGPVHQAFLAALRDYSPVERYGALEDVDFTVDNPAVVQNPSGLIEKTEDSISNSTSKGDSSKEIPEYLRYAPVVASGIGYLQSMFTNPDYEHANALMREADALRAPQVKFNPLNRYLRYNPIDRNYILNQLRGQSGATRRAIANAGTNPGTTMAGMLAADYNAQNALGDSLIKMQQYNDNQRQMVENFNRGTDQYNSQGFLEADTFNARSRADRDARRLAYIDRALQMKEQSDAMLEATRSANASNFFNQLGQIGRENTDTNILEKLKDSDLFGALNEAMSKGLLTKSKGGKLNKKSRK